MDDGERVVKIFVLLGALFAFLGVALGAFGAHGLRGRLPAADLEIFETGVRYQIYHALGLFAVAWLTTRVPDPWVAAAGWLMVAGIVVFSGSLYLLVLSGIRWLGAVTPVGGLALLASWLALGIAVLRA